MSVTEIKSGSDDIRALSGAELDEVSGGQVSRGILRRWFTPVVQTDVPTIDIAPSPEETSMKVQGTSHESRPA